MSPWKISVLSGLADAAVGVGWLRLNRALEKNRMEFQLQTRHFCVPAGMVESSTSPTVLSRMQSGQSKHRIALHRDICIFLALTGYRERNGPAATAWYRYAVLTAEVFRTLAMCSVSYQATNASEEILGAERALDVTCSKPCVEAIVPISTMEPVKNECRALG
ncbi:uncharacterized protein DSM5745_06893 [Aspergillus mulundensis]|uniref:Uncharacterized protein n=1 Tax=Aspergillus mulundensis TaxID=1810919 RepID=A0A3D8RSW0_9EURO|nr:hypothetical protein DSM5745_06893 [Aspergillus mulundensis]RDW76901.1 hypothetical protein DSM5745_06893 [Aspergillus mulundensis]